MPRIETRQSSRVVTPADYSALDLTLFKQHIKWDAGDTSEDDLMRTYLAAAITQAEDYTGRVISSAAWATHLGGFYSLVTMDVHPIDTDLIVVKYYDVNNAEQTLADSEYVVLNNGDDYVQIKFNGTLPELYSRDEPVWIEYNAGYTTMPAGLQSEIIKRAADLFEVRTHDHNGALTPVTFDFHRAIFRYKML